MQNNKSFRLNATHFNRVSKSPNYGNKQENEKKVSKYTISSRIDDFRRLLVEELTTNQSNGDNFFQFNIESHILNLIYLLKKFPSFTNFLKHNKIDDNCLHSAVIYFKHLKLKKGQYIFKPGDTSDGMYGIIQGRVSILEYNTEIGIDNSWGNNGENLLELFRISEEPAKILFLNSRRGFRNTKFTDNSTNQTNPIFSTNFYQRLQEKILKGVGKRRELTEGMCFGESDLINRRKRQQGALVSEDSDLFFIEKENFESTLFKSISKSESERIVFVYNKIPVFINLPKKKFDEFYIQAIDFVTYADNEIIYEDGDKSEFIYLIYQGECCLKRDISKPYVFDLTVIKSTKEKDKKDNDLNRNRIEENFENSSTFSLSKISILNCNSKLMLENNSNLSLSKSKHETYKRNAGQSKNQSRKYFDKSNVNYETILKLNPGDACGLECAAGLSFLNHTLIASNPFTVIAKIDLKKIADYEKRIFAYFLPIYIEKEKIIESFVKSHRSLKNKIRLKFSGRKEIRSESSTKKEVDFEFEEKVNSMIQDIQTKKRTVKFLPRRDLKFFTVDKFDENIFRKTSLKKTENIFNESRTINISNNNSRFEVSDFFTNKRERRNIKNKTYNANNFLEITTMNKTRLRSTSNKSKILGKDKEKERSMSINFSRSPAKTKTKIKLKIFDDNNKNNQSANSNFNKSLLSPFEIMKNSNLSKNTIFKNKEKINNLKTRNNKSASHKNQLSYNTGNFDIPLISFNMENYRSNNERIQKLKREMLQQENINDRENCHLNNTKGNIRDFSGRK